MPLPDDFSSYIAELLQGSYDCVDRIALRAYFRLAQTSGGFLTWWDRLFPGQAPTQQYLRQMAGTSLHGLRLSAKSTKSRCNTVSSETGTSTKKPKRRDLKTLIFKASS